MMYSRRRTMPDLLEVVLQPHPGGIVRPASTHGGPAALQLQLHREHPYLGEPAVGSLAHGSRASTGQRTGWYQELSSRGSRRSSGCCWWRRQVRWSLKAVIMHRRAHEQGSHMLATKTRRPSCLPASARCRASPCNDAMAPFHGNIHRRTCAAGTRRPPDPDLISTKIVRQ